MVAPRLIVGAAIGRAQVEAFVLCGAFGGVKVDTEGHADEPPRPLSRIGAGFARQLDFDHAVLKFGIIQNDELNSVCDARRRVVSHAQSFSPLVGHLFRFHVTGLHLARIVQLNGCGLDLCKPSTQRRRQNSDQDKHGLFHQSPRTQAQASPKFLHSFSPCIESDRCFSETPTGASRSAQKFHPSNGYPSFPPTVAMDARLIKTALSPPRPETIDPAFRPSNRPTTRASSLSNWLYSVSTRLRSVVHALPRSPDRISGRAGFSSHRKQTAETPIARGIRPDRDCQTSPKA